MQQFIALAGKATAAGFSYISAEIYTCLTQLLVYVMERERESIEGEGRWRTRTNIYSDMEKEKLLCPYSTRQFSRSRYEGLLSYVMYGVIFYIFTYQ